MSGYAQVNHLLDRVEVGIVEIPEEPEDPRAKYFPQENDKGGEVEDVDHPYQPVDEHRRPWCCCERLESRIQNFNEMIGKSCI